MKTAPFTINRESMILMINERKRHLYVILFPAEVAKCDPLENPMRCKNIYVKTV